MKALLLIASILGVLALTGTAAADSSNRASVIDYQDCSSTPFGTTCMDINVVSTWVLTASGNSSVLVNGTSAFTSMWPALGCTHTISDRLHDQKLTRVDDEQTHSYRLTQTVTEQCGASSLTCVSNLAVHLVDGEPQFQRDDLVCNEL